MKISLIGPGFSEIPPKGWGACEILIWDYKCSLEDAGHEVQIINTTDCQKMISDIKSFSPDFVHCQYDNHCHILNSIDCTRAITTHYAYLEQPEKHGGYIHVLENILNTDCFIFALSSGIRDFFIEKKISEDKIIVNPNGARDDLFIYKKECLYPDRSICIGKIEWRKKQQFVQDLDCNVYFAGNYENSGFKLSNSSYLGEWTKKDLYNNLTDYANLVLLSDGEAHPLVTCEALVAGLGLVVSEYASANLDRNLPFIDVISNNKINDRNYIRDIIQKNRKKSISLREDIRKYALDNFSYKFAVIPRYLDNIRKAKEREVK